MARRSSRRIPTAYLESGPQGAGHRRSPNIGYRCVLLPARASSRLAHSSESCNQLWAPAHRTRRAVCAQHIWRAARRARENRILLQSGLLIFAARAPARGRGARTRRGRRTSSHKIFHTKPCRIGGSRPRIRWAMRGLTELRGRRRVPRVKLHVDVGLWPAGAALEALNPRRLP